MTMTGLCDECGERPAVARVVRLGLHGEARGSVGAFCAACLAEVAAWPAWRDQERERRAVDYPPVTVEGCNFN
jgi:hypothetical protein